MCGSINCNSIILINVSSELVERIVESPHQTLKYWELSHPSYRHPHPPPAGSNDDDCIHCSAKLLLLLFKLRCTNLSLRHVDPHDTVSLPDMIISRRLTTTRSVSVSGSVVTELLIILFSSPWFQYV